jgi:hypothetical protein
MKSHISKAKLAALAVGIAIVMSSCGIQNQAGDSSSAPAAGKTKNAAFGAGLLGDLRTCFYSFDEARAYYWSDVYAPTVNEYWTNGATALYTELYNELSGWYWGGGGRGEHELYIKDSCDLPIELTAYNPEAEGSIISAQRSGNIKACLKPEVKQAMIDGYTEQLARPLGGEVTEAYIAEMQKGLEVTKATCTN